MHAHLILKLLGAIHLFWGVIMLLPLSVAVIDNWRGFWSFLGAMLLCTSLSFFLYWRNRHVTGEISRRAGFAIVGLVWISIACFAALPFYFYGNGFGYSFTNALFESISGLTTTGASILPQVSHLPKSILFWRALLQWIGGLGIVLLSLAVLPMLGIGGVQLFRAEASCATGERITPRIKDTAKLLWWVYLLLTVLVIFFLQQAGMPFFDAVCHGFSTISTAGFSTQDTSIMFYNSPLIEMIITLFMLIGGCNFTLHYLALKGKPLNYFYDTEFRGYVLVVFGISLFIAINLYWTGVYKDFITAMRHALFQTASIMTTTGHNSADFELWRLAAPATAIMLMIAMFLGGMSGSTSGGVKIIRMQVLCQVIYNTLKGLIHPRAVTKVRIHGSVISEEQIKAITAFFILYWFIFVISTLILSLVGLDMVSAISAVAASINDVGPGFGMVGPLSNYNAVPILGKWVLMLDMLIGRLEVFTILLLFIPEFWKK